MVRNGELPKIVGGNEICANVTSVTAAILGLFISRSSSKDRLFVTISSSSGVQRMSFQHFRLGELALHQPLPPHLMQHQGTSSNINGASSLSQFAGQTDNTNNSFDNNPPNGHDISSSSSTKQPYGSGDTDDGYTLVFPNIQAFHDWRNKEEETQMVEFVKVRAFDASYSFGQWKVTPLFLHRATLMGVRRYPHDSKTTPNLCARVIHGVAERSM